MAEANEQEQMEMAFLDDGLERDPVSGNEIPTGSLAEEVRDDVPAMLSEGEYVVPADVLRFYGVKFFEDLRAQAKEGLATMEANGRIGGTPVEEAQENNVLPFPVEELETEEEEIEMAVGGYIKGYNEAGVVDGSGFISKSYWDGKNINTVITVAFIGNEAVSNIPIGYVPYTQGDTIAPSLDSTKEVKNKKDNSFKLFHEAQEKITAERYDDKGNRIPMDINKIVDYTKQLQGFGPMNIGWDDIVTKIPVIGNLTSAMLAKQHSEILDDAKGLLALGTANEEQTKILKDLIAGNEGYTPGRSILHKGIETAKNIISPTLKKDKKDKTSPKIIDSKTATGKKAEEEYGKADDTFGALNKGGLMRKGKK